MGEFIAYGGASTHGNAEDGYTFECQHGPRECAGNIVQGCTVHHVYDMMMQVELLNCMSAASKPEEAGEECFTQFGADWAPVQACIDGPEGAEMHAKNGEIQNSLEPRVWGVPWPLWDGVGGDEVLQGSILSFQGSFRHSRGLFDHSEGLLDHSNIQIDPRND